MSKFINILIVWVLFAWVPVLTAVGFVSFVAMDLSLFNPANWEAGDRFLVGAWVTLMTILVFFGVITNFGED